MFLSVGVYMFCWCDRLFVTVAGTLFGTSFSHGDPGAAFIPQLPASIGRIPTNYPTGQHSFHPYRRA